MTNLKPAEVMGYFWLVLGLVVLVGSFSIKSSDRVLQTHDVVTNLIGAGLLILIGLVSVLSGRSMRKKEDHSKMTDR